MLDVPSGLVADLSAAPVYWSADQSTAALPTLTAPISRNWIEERSVTFSDDFAVTSLHSDPDAETHTVNHIVRGEPAVVVFRPEDERPEGNDWLKEIDDLTYWMWQVTWEDHEYISAFAFGAYSTDLEAENPIAPRSYFVGGPRTMPDALPEGDATFDGYFRSDSFQKDDPSSTLRRRVYGDVNLAVDFAEGTLSGRVDGLEFRGHGEVDRHALPEDMHFVIDSGQIINGQYTAQIRGMGETEIDETVAGYAGNVIGEFYGPAADETGAVFNAESENRIMVGVILGESSE